MLTKQAIFNRALDGVVRQGGPSMNGPGCAYRGDEGRACGIGQLIDDQYYDPAFDDKDQNNGGGIFDLMSLATRAAEGAVGRRFVDALVASGVDITDAYTHDLCKEIQQAHDSSAFMRHYESNEKYMPKFLKSMREVAKNYGLEMPC